MPGGAFIDEGIYWIDLFRWLAAQRGRAGRGEDRQPGAQGHRGRRLGHGDVHVRQRRDRDARGVVDDQRAAENRPVAEAEQRRAARSGRHARRNHRSVVPRAGTGGAGRRRQRLGVRAAVRGAVRAGVRRSR